MGIKIQSQAIILLAVSLCVCECVSVNACTCACKHFRPLGSDALISRQLPCCLTACHWDTHSNIHWQTHTHTHAHAQQDKVQLIQLSGGSISAEHLSSAEWNHFYFHLLRMLTQLCDIIWPSAALLLLFICYYGAGVQLRWWGKKFGEMFSKWQQIRVVLPHSTKWPYWNSPCLWEFVDQHRWLNTKYSLPGSYCSLLDWKLPAHWHFKPSTSHTTHTYTRIKGLLDCFALQCYQWLIQHLQNILLM